MRRVRIALVMVLVLFLSTPASSTRTNPWGQSGGGAGGWVGTATSDLVMGENDITLSAGQTVDGVDVSLFKQDMTFLLDQPGITLRRETADSVATPTQRNTNETAFADALNDACSDATAGGSTDGGILHLPPGRFSVDAATLDIDCRVIIQGTGRQGFTLGGSEIYINATGLSTHGLQITSDNVVLRDLLINCDNADTAGFNCVEAVDSGGTIAKVVFDNISINGDGATYTTTTGLEIDGAQEFVIKNSFIDTFGRAVHFMGSGSAGGNQITNSWLRTPDGYGEVVLITGADPIRDLTIHGTTIQRGITGIRLNPDDSTNASVLNLSNNYFETTCTDASPDDGTCDVGGGSEAALTNVLIDSDAGFTSNQDFYNPSTATAVSRTTAQATGTDMIISPWLRGDVSYSAGTCSTTGLIKGAGDISDCTTFVNPSSTVAWTGAHNFDGTFAIGTRETFSDPDDTPDVGTGSFFITNTPDETIIDFDGSGIVAGQIIHVESAGAITYDCTSAGFACGSTDIVTAAGDATSWIYDGTDWILIAFMDQSVDMGTGAGTADDVQTATLTFGDGSATVIHTYDTNSTDPTVTVTNDGAIAFSGAVSATSFAADASATPSWEFNDTVADDTGAESKIVADAVADDNGRITIQVEAGVDNTYETLLDASSTGGSTTVAVSADAISLTGPVVISGGLDAAPKGATSTGGALTINTVTLATAAGDYDLPDACDTATFNSVTLMVRDVSETVSLTVTDSADQIHYKGLSLDADDELDSPGAALDSVTVICMEAGEWYVTSSSGDWIDGGAAD